MKFTSVLKWELRNIVRFPIIELLILLLTYQVMSSAFVSARTQDLGYNPLAALPQGQMLTALFTVVAQGLAGAFISISFIGAVAATMLFAYEFETGLTKFYMSLPIKRTQQFLAKLLSCFLVPFLMLLAVGCIAEIFLNPVSVQYFFSAPETLANVMLLLGEMALFIVAVCITISIFSHNTAISFIGSLAILYGLQLIGNRAFPVLPPTSLDTGLIWYLFQPSYWNQYPGWHGTAILIVTPILSATLLIVSYSYYCRRLNV